MPVAGTAAATALAYAAVGTAVVGTGLSVYSAVQQGKAAEDRAKFQEDMANNQAIQARQNAEFEAKQVSRRNKLVLGKQRAAAAKSGVLIGGSVTDVIEDSTVQGEMDRLATLYIGESQATSAAARAELADAAQGNIRTNTLLTASGQFLSGASSVAGQASRLPSFQNGNPADNSITVNGWLGPTSHRIK